MRKEALQTIRIGAALVALLLLAMALASSNIHAEGALSPIPGAASSSLSAQAWPVAEGDNVATRHECDPDWTVVPSPSTGVNGAYLFGVATISSSDVWAVGIYHNGSVNQTLIEHWDGSAWNIVTSPNVGTYGNFLVGVSAASSTDVWAVGRYDTGNFSDETLIEHWNGSIWSVVPSPNPPDSLGNGLDAVAVVSTNDVWAVGSYSDAGVVKTLTEHWDGSTWSVIPSPNPPSSVGSELNGVAVVSSNDVWAVGSSQGQTLIEHWDGSAWNIVTSPNVGVYSALKDVAAVSGSDVWAVGNSSNGTVSQTLIEHWNGSAWTVVSSQNAGTYDNYLYGVVAVGAGDIWAVGYYSNGSAHQTLIEHSGVVVPSPNLGTYDDLLEVAALGPGDIWAVGAYSGTTAQTLVERYNPCAPTSTPSPTRTQAPTQTPGGATATSTPAPCLIQFTDVPSTDTFYANIRCLACRGIISGYADGTFKPNNLVTRGQLAKIVSNAAGFTESPDPRIFEDVPPENTFYAWINRLARRGFMSGYPCGGPGEPCTGTNPYFRPFANATRGQTSKIVSNAAGYSDVPIGQTFEDVPPTHTFYAEIQRLASRNIMQGYPCGGPGEPCLTGKPYFRPQNNVTRGQSAKIVSNTFFPGCQTP